MHSNLAANLQPGDQIDGRYALGECIGQGGMGSVYLAEQIVLGRPVAIKFLHAELSEWPGHARRMHDEAIAACRVRSPHCVAVLDRGALPDGTPYLVMERVGGRSLARVIAEESIPLPRAVDLLEQILAALAAVHDAGVVHGDVKSDNFMVEALNGKDHVTLIDFGLARFADALAPRDAETGELMVSGTPEYMAPEVIGGDPPGPLADLYGAGVILYELLTGAPPFVGGTAREIMLRHADEPVVAPSLRRPERELPAALDRAVIRALAKQPAGRFPDAAAFAREIRAAATGSRAVVGRWPRRDDSSMAYAPTRDWSVQSPPPRIARGSDICPARDPEVLRGAIGEALARGDVGAIATGYLALAGALASDRRFASAARELQEGIDVLVAGCPARAFGGRHPADQLITALAQLRGAPGTGT